jgi:hypothetical protein
MKFEGEFAAVLIAIITAGDLTQLGVSANL